MMKKESTKYVGHILSTKGGLHDTVEDRQQKGWGIITNIMVILSVVDMDGHQVEAGLMLRQSLLISSMLFSAEAWSGLTDKQHRRFDLVDTALLGRLTGGHSQVCHIVSSFGNWDLATLTSPYI